MPLDLSTLEYPDGAGPETKLVYTLEQERALATPGSEEFNDTISDLSNEHGIAFERAQRSGSVAVQYTNDLPFSAVNFGVNITPEEVDVEKLKAAYESDDPKKRKIQPFLPPGLVVVEHKILRDIGKLDNPETNSREPLNAAATERGLLGWDGKHRAVAAALHALMRGIPLEELTLNVDIEAMGLWQYVTKLQERNHEHPNITHARILGDARESTFLVLPDDVLEHEPRPTFPQVIDAGRGVSARRLIDGIDERKAKIIETTGELITEIFTGEPLKVMVSTFASLASIIDGLETEVAAAFRVRPSPEDPTPQPNEAQIKDIAQHTRYKSDSPSEQERETRRTAQLAILRRINEGEVFNIRQEYGINKLAGTVFEPVQGAKGNGRRNKGKRKDQESSTKDRKPSAEEPAGDSNDGEKEREVSPEDATHAALEQLKGELMALENTAQRLSAELVTALNINDVDRRTLARILKEVSVKNALLTTGKPIGEMHARVTSILEILDKDM